MKHRFHLFAFCALLAALPGRAVIITWMLPEASTAPQVTPAESAQLVYLSGGGLEVNSSGSPLNATAAGAALTGTALTNAKARETQVTDFPSVQTRESGVYYVILLKVENSVTYYSTASVEASQISYYTDATDPSPLASTTWSPVAFTAWAVAPEPATAMLFLLGAALAALRRGREKAASLP